MYTCTHVQCTCVTEYEYFNTFIFVYGIMNFFLSKIKREKNKKKRQMKMKKKHTIINKHVNMYVHAFTWTFVNVFVIPVVIP